MVKFPDDILTYYHTRHTCGHSVYWSDKVLAYGTSYYPCQWCGAETGTHKPPDGSIVEYMGFRNTFKRVWIFQKFNDDGSVPWCEGMPGGIDDPVRINHRRDNSCCDEGKQHARMATKTHKRKA